MFNSVLVANRGEIARRVFATARRMGLETIAVFSEADANAAHVADADRAVLIGPASARESYLVPEKIIAAASKQFVCIVDDTKLVATLGKFPLPVEVIPMARRYVASKLTALGGQPVFRDGVVTDNGIHILDVHNLTINDPVTLEQKINQIVGVVTAGLFAKRGADVLIIGSDKGIDTL